MVPGTSLNSHLSNHVNDVYILRSSHQRRFAKNGVLKNFAKFTEKHLCWSLFLIKLHKLYWKETPTQMFSCEFCDNFKNTYLEEHLQMVASPFYLFNPFQASAQFLWTSQPSFTCSKSTMETLEKGVKYVQS